jgi:predicted Zn-dependent protease
MVDFLRIMRRYEFYSNTIPSYFLTHPGTDERIRYLDGLLQTRYTGRGAKTIIGGLRRIQTTLMFGERNLDITLRYFQDILEERPNDVDALYGLAVTQAKLGLTADSFGSFDRALKLAPNDQDVLRDLGINYLKIGKTSDAIRVLKRAYLLDESDVRTIFYLGRSYEAAKDYHTALNLYRELKEKDPDNINAYYCLAMAYGRTNNQAESHYNFGIYFKKKKNIKSALFHFKEALKCYPENSEKAREIQKEIGSIRD